jgi:hypothetical protein
MADLNGCQLCSLPRLAEGRASLPPQPFIRNIKRYLAVPWNNYVKKWLKYTYHAWSERSGPTKAQSVAAGFAPAAPLQAGDWVHVRSREEILSTLDPFHELKRCAFMNGMYQYCGSRQRVFKVMQRFLDERDYKFEKVRGVVLLENVICQGTPVSSLCDRSCFFFWREEWLEKIE